MIRALDFENKKRWIEPTYTGQIGICPICKNEVKAAIYLRETNRFRHSFNQGCAFDNKTITDWHLSWQSLFDNTEYRFPELGLRADILFPKGLVLELQHSPIKFKDMKYREQGYGKIVWLFNLTSEKYQKNIFVKNNTIVWEYPNKHWLCYTKPAFWQVEDDMIIDLTNIKIEHDENKGGYSKAILKANFFTYSIDEFIKLMYKIDNSGIKNLPISFHRTI